MPTQAQVRNSQLVDILAADFVNCWMPIDQAVLAAPVGTVTFANLPQYFRCLVLSVCARTDDAATNDAVAWRANGDAGNNYDWVRVYGNNAAAGSSNVIPAPWGRAGFCDAANSRASCFSGGWTWFPNYRNASQEKMSWMVGGNVGTPSAATIYVAVYDSHWRNTAAITSLTLQPSSGANFVANSTFQLWGVL